MKRVVKEKLLLKKAKKEWTNIGKKLGWLLDFSKDYYSDWCTFWRYFVSKYVVGNEDNLNIKKYRWIEEQVFELLSKENNGTIFDSSVNPDDLEYSELLRGLSVVYNDLSKEYDRLNRS